MDPVTVVIVLATVLTGWTSFWPWIRCFMEERLIPWIREKCSGNFAEGFADLVAWLDNRMVAIRSVIKDAYRYFKTRVLRMQTKFTKTSASAAKRETETYLKLENGKVLRRVETEAVSWEDIPDSIRSDIIRQNAAVGTVDDREVIVKKVEEKAAVEGIEVVMAG